MALEIQTDPAEAWSLVRRNAAAIKNLLPQMNSTLSSGGVTLEFIIFEIYQRVNNSKNQLQALSLVPGLDAYVASIKTGYVATDAIATIVGFEQSLLDWIDTNASGLNLSGDTAAKAIASGSVVSNRFTPAQTTQLRARITAIYEAITG